jgi:hypothetical protein
MKLHFGRKDCGQIFNPSVSDKFSSKNICQICFW